MNTVGREYRQQAAMLDALERIAKACEKMGEDPVLEVEIGPPVCPHCGILNPKVSYEDTAGTGQLYEYFIMFECEECDKVFAAAPIQWSMHTSQHTLEAEMKERAGKFNDNNDERAAATFGNIT
jgi:ribosomal protein L37AE/L43A